MGRKKSTTDDFIKKSEIIHKNKYDYSFVEYINNSTKIKIICTVHGIFLQSPLNHNIKNTFCKDNGIKLVRIKFDDDIKKIINNNVNI